MLARRVEILGVPFNSAGTTAGVARAPAALREAGLMAAIRATGVDVVDAGDVTVGPTDSVRDPVSGLIAPGALTSMILATRAGVDAILQSDPELLFVDGHEDAWPPRLSTSGEAADMELGLALGLNLDGLPKDLVAVLPRLDQRRVLVVGPRDQGELAEAGVPSIDGVVEIIRDEALAATDPERAGADAASRLAGMGPWCWEALTRLTRGALANPDVLGWDVTIYNPDLDPTGTDARRIVRYVAEAMGG